MTKPSLTTTGMREISAVEAQAVGFPNVFVTDYVSPDMTPDLLWAAASVPMRMREETG